MGRMRQTPADEQERRSRAVTYLEKIGLPQPVFHFLDAGFQAGVKAAWPWGDTHIGHAVRFKLATQYEVTTQELDEAAYHLMDWFKRRSARDDVPRALSGQLSE